LRERRDGILEMLEHVGEDERVEALAGGGEIGQGLRQITLDDPVAVPSRPRRQILVLF
jgi:hypothetical protein